MMDKQLKTGEKEQDCSNVYCMFFSFTVDSTDKNMIIVYSSMVAINTFEPHENCNK